MAENGAVIRLEGVEKVFQASSGPLRVLERIDLSVARGSVFGLIGRSGAGKSTLLRLVNRLEIPSEGRVLVSGQDVGTLGPEGLTALRRRVGMVFQHFNLISAKTVAQNVALPLQVAGLPKPEIAARLAEVLARVGLSGCAESYPAQLSGGQKQRVGIARALISRPEVLLCDEATSALDPETTRAILELLRQLNADLGLTILLITHEMAVVRAICDTAAVLEQGRLVEKSAVWQIFAAPKSLTARALLGVEDPALPPDLSRRLSQAPTPGSRPVIRLSFDGSRPAHLPEGRWLAGRIERLQGHDLGQVLMALAPGAVLPPDAEVMGHVPADA